MNYHFINVGSSMNSLFNRDGKVNVKSASNIDLRPLCEKQNFILAQDVLRNLRDEMRNSKSIRNPSLKKSSNLFFCIEDNS